MTPRCSRTRQASGWDSTTDVSSNRSKASFVLPITLAVFGFLQRWQARHVFRTLDIHPQSDRRGFLGYLFVYQVLISAAALRGYGQFIVSSGRRWK
jgi:hypothetical protein